ncbi:hypothetical protein QFZ68_000998 [Streptomyces sp. V1I6]|nr:hypothetical protein [Streptomyces sp. V1I6]
MTLSGLPTGKDEDRGCAVRLDEADLGVRNRLLRDRDEEASDLVGALHDAKGRLGLAAAVADQPYVRGEDGEQSLQIAARGGGQEPLREVTAFGRIHVVPVLALLHVLARTPGELAYGRLRLLQRGGDLGVGEAERLAEHEHRALQRREGLEDHEHGERHGFGEHRPFRRVGDRGAEVGDDGLGQPRPDVRLAAGLDVPQPVDREAGGDPDEVAARLLHVVAPVGRPAQPGLLHHVLRVGDAAEHAVGHAGQHGPVFFEEVGHGVCCHPSIPADGGPAVQQVPVRRALHR